MGQRYNVSQKLEGVHAEILIIKAEIIELLKNICLDITDDCRIQFSELKSIADDSQEQFSGLKNDISDCQSEFSEWKIDYSNG